MIGVGEDVLKQLICEFFSVMLPANSLAIIAFNKDLADIFDFHKSKSMLRDVNRDFAMWIKCIFTKQWQTTVLT